MPFLRFEMKTTPLCAASGFWVPYPRWSGSSTSKVDISKHLGLFGNTGCWWSWQHQAKTTGEGSSPPQGAQSRTP